MTRSWSQAGVQRALVAAARAGAVAHAAFLPLSIAGMQIGLVVSAVALLAIAWTRGRAWAHGLLDAPVLLFCAAAVLSIGIAWAAGSPPVGWFGATLWRSFLAPLVLLSAIAVEAPGERGDASRRAILVLCTWAVAAVATAAIAWYQYRSGADVLYEMGLRRAPFHPPLPPRDTARFAANGLFKGYTVFAQNLSPPLLLAAALALFAPLPRRQRLLLGIAAALATFTVALTFSRIAWAALVVAGLVLLVLGDRRRAGRAIAVLAAVLVAATLVAPDLHRRLARAVSPEAFADRRMIWGVCAAVVRDHPVFGVGWGNLHPRVHAYYDRLAPDAGVQAGCHDVFYTLYAEGGLLLVVAGVAYWALLLRGLWRARRRAAPASLASAAAAGGFAGTLALLLNGLFHDVFYSSEPMYGLGFALAIAAALSEPRAASIDGEASTSARDRRARGARAGRSGPA